MCDNPKNGFWKVKEIDGMQIQIITRDGKFKIFSMFHSGFGVSGEDVEIAQHVVDLHNTSIKDGTQNENT